MSSPTPPAPFCDHIECVEPARFAVHWGTSIDGFVNSCRIHLGELIGRHPGPPAAHYRVYPIEQPSA